MFVVGRLYHRGKDIHDKYDGNRQSGISPCSKHPYVFLFHSPKGEEHGYKDGWLSATEYQYTGEGQSGDMELIRGNLAIKNHVTDQRELHLFEKQPNGLYKYLGRFKYISHDTRQVNDSSGQIRKHIVFRLQLVPSR